MNIRTYIYVLTATVAISAELPILAQEMPAENQEIDYGVTYLEPLFDYPIAPEELPDFASKCDWLAENFWNPMDWKQKEAVDQVKLNHAFGIYATTCQYASKEKVSGAIDKILKALQKNPTLLVQLTKAAEENIYGPRAEVWIDELYVKILRAAIGSKKFPKTRKARYELQLKQLENSMIGNSPISFNFKRANGVEGRYFPMATPTILFFGDPNCEDCRFARLRMEANVAFSKAITDGKVNVLYIIPDAEEGWEKETSDYPKNWTVGASDMVTEEYDLRAIPDIYVIDGEGKIRSKHVTPIQAMNQVLEMLK